MPLASLSSSSLVPSAGMLLRPAPAKAAEEEDNDDESGDSRALSRAPRAIVAVTTEISMGGAGGGGGGGGDGGSVMRKVVASYAYVSIWIMLSFTVIVYNKYILDPKMYGWAFPSR
uniref:Uncharacterized protein n=1 Tax=Ananas comosus var. bracteatus TaxID=296719 RepID=A0A6V7NFB3_ANACO|nr:unnamed protein product [Ananas comosus var. bracteatus]